jgi:hypothetical protein
MLRWTLACCAALRLGISAGCAQTLAPRPVQAVLTGRFQDPTLRESSGVALSRAHAGLLFTINDSGNPPEIFATDSSGRAEGRWRVSVARNRDWEALSIGPCPSGTCFYIGDIGDNLEQQPEVVVYRITVPSTLQPFRGAADPLPVALDSAVVRYPDGPHDAEATWVGDEGDLFIVTKGRTGGIKLFRVPAAAFGSGRPVSAALVQLVPIEADRSIGRWVTDAARSPDGRRVAIRTYTELYLFPLTVGGRLGQPVSCNVAGLEPQGEGVAWLDDRRLIFTSEAPPGTTAGPIHIVTCGG